MNEQMQNAIVKFIDKANSGIDASVGFLSAEIPDVIEQLIMYKMVASLISFFICSAIVSLCVYTNYRAITDFEKSVISGKSCWVHDGTSYSPLTITAVFSCLFASIAGTMCLLTAIVEIFEIAKIWLAPKIWLIEYAASLAK